VQASSKEALANWALLVKVHVGSFSLGSDQ
jgi:hypothetical protein